MIWRSNLSILEALVAMMRDPAFVAGRDGNVLLANRLLKASIILN